jgi:hypothetical protein
MCCASLQFALLLDDVLLGQVEADTFKLGEAEEDKQVVISGIVQLFPFQLRSARHLKARATCDGEPLKGGTLVFERDPSS